MFIKFLQENFLGAFTKKSKYHKYICMDEHKNSKSNVSAKKLAKVMNYYQSDDQPLGIRQPFVHEGDIKGIKKINHNSNNNNSVRVKVLMTKEEADRLLAKSKKEGKIEFKDVVNELAKLPLERVSVVSHMANAKEIVLPSIF